MIDPLVFSSFALQWFVKEIEKDLFGDFFVRVMPAGIVAPIIVIVPGGQYPGGSSQLLKLRFSPPAPVR
ncbi:MAG: hypothetical protein EBT80_05925 [Chitinophagales bacterium]|nr:hypothetical protein [Chitinophagales bacterium]